MTEQAANGPLKVIVVTDPLCSWCWGMAPAVEVAAARLTERFADRVTFDFLLGGVNVQSSLPVGDYGRRLLLRIWSEVQATTGQAFGFHIPEGFVYNSVRPCLAVRAVQRAIGRPPFGYLHRLQQLFFLDGMDVGEPQLLARTAEDFGVDRGEILRALDDPALLAALRAEFDGARGYGTQALPNLITESGGKRTLLTGGYADADMLESLVRERLAAVAGY